MRKQTLLRLILALIILVVWGKIVYDRIGIGETDTETESSNSVSNTISYGFIDDALKALNADTVDKVDTDPFYHGKSEKPNKMPKATKIFDKRFGIDSSANDKRRAHYQKVISYQGMVENKSSGYKQALISAYGRSYILSPGESIGDSIKLMSCESHYAVFQINRGVIIKIETLPSESLK